jgi:hypothetical protein
MLLPDATKVEVHVDDPGKHAEHVVAALEFADWAYRTPEEREAAAAHEQAMVDSIQAEIDANRRMVSIISGKPGKDCYNDEELCELAMKAAKSGMATEFNNRGPMLATRSRYPTWCESVSRTTRRWLKRLSRTRLRLLRRRRCPWRRCSRATRGGWRRLSTWA